MDQKLNQVEQQAFNLSVAGSNPAWSSIIKNVDVAER